MSGTIYRISNEQKDIVYSTAYRTNGARRNGTYFVYNSNYFAPVYTRDVYIVHS